MKRIALPALMLAAFVAGCGVPQEVPEQAAEVSSIAAEGSLLAHDAAEGSTTETFTREHAKALRKLLQPLRPAIEQPDLASIAAGVDATLRVLAEAPGDEVGARTLGQSLDRAARSAEELA